MGRDVIISGGRDRTVRVWNPGSAEPVQVFECLDAVRGLALAEETVIVAAGLSLIGLGPDDGVS